MHSTRSTTGAAVDHDDSTPIIVGVGRLTRKSPQVDASDLTTTEPIEIMTQAVQDAVRDTCVSDNVILDIDTIATVKMLMEESVPASLRPLFKNPPKSVGAAIGAKNTSTYFETTTGGQAPQMAINELCERIANGHSNAAILCGCECLSSFARGMRRMRSTTVKGNTHSGQRERTRVVSKEKLAEGTQTGEFSWGDDPGGRPVQLGYSMKYPLLDKSGFLHGIATPTTVYALFEQAIRRRRGATVDDHLRDISSLFSGFSHVAAAHPRDSWFPTAYTADELATVTAANRAGASTHARMVNQNNARACGYHWARNVGWKLLAVSFYRRESACMRVSGCRGVLCMG
eukprot:m.997714 g.997714  ORF g.997714 m.997714 type:complete len:344 (+) comp24022_c1_seq29:223-1254(+)